MTRACQEFCAGAIETGRKNPAMAIEKDILDQLLAGRSPQEIFSRDGLVDELKKALSDRIFNAEIDEHLDGERGEGKPGAGL